MAVQMEKPDEKEAKIPVFTVQKKDSILKNIFLNNPPPPESESPVGGSSGGNQEKSGREEEKILIGRHPDCHIVLDHPSISRFHLEIRTEPSLQKLSVTDLSSVHGTWVSGNKIQPLIPVDLAEGDMMKLGASSRVYKLRWVLLSSAFELDNPLAALPEEKEETHQDEFCMPVMDNSSGLWPSQIPSAPPMPRSMNTFPSHEDFSVLSARENQSSATRIPEEMGILKVTTELESASSPLPMERATENRTPEAFLSAPVAPEGENPSPPRSEKRVMSSSLMSRRSKSVSFLRIHKGMSRERMGCPSFDTRDQKENSIVFKEVKREETLGKVLFSGLDGEGDEVEETFLSDKENMTPQVSRSSRRSKKDQTELHRSSSNVDAGLKWEEHGFLKEKENCTTPEVPLDMKERKLISENNIRTEKEEEDTFALDKENLTPQVSGDPKSKNHISESRQRIEREIMMRRVERVPFQSLLQNSPSNNSPATVAIATPRNSNLVTHPQKSDHKNNSISANQSVDQVSHKAGERKKWNIVVDTSCFLNEESKRSLQLLEGLKGTHLIIPRMVIRELDCLKRRESRFRKATKASSVLQWIEECMVRTSWWIHVQSSVESILVAPTPPASPRLQLSEGSNEFASCISNSMPFSTCGSLAEILSPTAEDHILDCALLFKRNKNDGHLVLLTHDIALKIKAMAEGLLCETPREFRESLVNPYSERFLWVESSPRGPTWSCSDEVGLVENYYHHCSTMRKTAKAAEGAKGLKLILLHNSHYAQTNSVK